MDRLYRPGGRRSFLELPYSIPLHTASGYSFRPVRLVLVIEPQVSGPNDTYVECGYGRCLPRFAAPPPAELAAVA